jgi:hypothetical protein
VIVDPDTDTDVAGKVLKVIVFVVQPVVKAPPVKLKEVPPLRGPFMGTIEFKLPPTIGKM